MYTHMIWKAATRTQVIPGLCVESGIVTLAKDFQGESDLHFSHNIVEQNQTSFRRRRQASLRPTLRCDIKSTVLQGVYIT